MFVYIHCTYVFVDVLNWIMESISEPLEMVFHGFQMYENVFVVTERYSEDFSSLLNSISSK